MNKKEAREVLAKNSLYLDYAGIDLIPMKTIQINYYEIMNETKYPHKNHGETTWIEQAVLLGVVGENNVTGSMDFDRGGDLICCCFFVKVGFTYYYRDFYEEAIEVIRALRVVNDFNHLEDIELTVI